MTLCLAMVLFALYLEGVYVSLGTGVGIWRCYWLSSPPWGFWDWTEVIRLVAIAFPAEPFFFFLFSFFEMGVLLCSSGWNGAHFIDWAGLKLIEIHWPLPPEWSMPPRLALLSLFDGPVFFLCLFVWDRISCIPDWPGSVPVAKDDL